MVILWVLHWNTFIEVVDCGIDYLRDIKRTVAAAISTIISELHHDNDVCQESSYNLK